MPNGGEKLAGKCKSRRHRCLRRKITNLSNGRVPGKSLSVKSCPTSRLCYAFLITMAGEKKLPAKPTSPPSALAGNFFAARPLGIMACRSQKVPRHAIALISQPPNELADWADFCNCVVKPLPGLWHDGRGPSTSAWSIASSSGCSARSLRKASFIIDLARARLSQTTDPIPRVPGRCACMAPARPDVAVIKATRARARPGRSITLAATSGDRGH